MTPPGHSPRRPRQHHWRNRAGFGSCGTGTGMGTRTGTGQCLAPARCHQRVPRLPPSPPAASGAGVQDVAPGRSRRARTPPARHGTAPRRAAEVGKPSASRVLLGAQPRAAAGQGDAEPRAAAGRGVPAAAGPGGAGARARSACGIAKAAAAPLASGNGARAAARALRRAPGTSSPTPPAPHACCRAQIFLPRTQFCARDTPRCRGTRGTQLHTHGTAPGPRGSGRAALR